jgi:hypothetical protein
MVNNIMSFYKKEYMKKWRKKNRNHIRKYQKKYMKKWRDNCKKNKLCLKCNRPLTAKDLLKSPYHKKCLLKERERNRKAWKKNKKWECERGRKKAFGYKLLALQKISKQKTPFCIKCGINDIRVLCVNHKGGNKRKENGLIFYIDIVKNRRKISNLDIRCANCNILYEYERRKRILPNDVPFGEKVIYKGSD